MKKIIVLIVIVISIILISIGIIIKSNMDNNKKTNEVINNNSVEKQSTKKEKSDQELKTETQELLSKFMSSSNYKKMDINDEVLSKYNALKPLIYYYDIYRLKGIGSNLIFSSITYDINDDNIRIEKETNNENGYIESYGYIKKKLLDEKIKNLFGSEKIKITNENNDEYITLKEGKFENVSQKYRNASLISIEDSEYYFKFNDIKGTYAYPTLNPVPIKLTEIREYDNYVLFISKAVYSKRIDSLNDSNIMGICSDWYCNNKIDEVTVGNSQYFTVNIDEYINNSETIYTIFKKKKDGYYFYRNIINDNL